MSTDYREEKKHVVFKIDAEGKVPVATNGGRMPKSNSPSTWSTLSEVTEFCDEHNKDGEAKFLPAEAMQYTDVFLDFDKVCNKETGELSEFAEEIIEICQLEGHGTETCEYSASGNLHVVLRVSDDSLMGWGSLPKYYGMDFEEDFPDQNVEFFSPKHNGTSGRFRVATGKLVEGVKVNAPESEQIALLEYLIDRFDYHCEIKRAFEKDSLEAQCIGSNGSTSNVELAVRVEEHESDNHVLRIEIPCSIEEAAVDYMTQKAESIGYLTGDHWQEGVFKLAAWAYRTIAPTIGNNKVNEWIIKSIEGKHDDNADKPVFIANIKARLRSLWATESKRTTPCEFIEVDGLSLGTFHSKANPDQHFNPMFGMSINCESVETIIESWRAQYIEGEVSDEEIAAEAQALLESQSDGSAKDRGYDFNKWLRSDCEIGNLMRHFTGGSNKNADRHLCTAVAMVNSVMTERFACSETTYETYLEDMKQVVANGGTMLGINQVTHPTLATLLLAPSGHGKESSSNMISMAMASAGLSHRAHVGALGSGQGLAGHLAEACPTTVFIKDEVASSLFPKKPTAVSDALSDFIKMLSTTNGSDFVPSLVKDQSKNTPIKSAAASFFFASQPKTVYGRVTAESIGDGLLGRFLVWECKKPDESMSKRRIGRTRPRNTRSLPNSWYDFLNRWDYIESTGDQDMRKYCINASGVNGINMAEITRRGMFHFTHDAIALYEDLCEEMENNGSRVDEEFEDVWQRVREKVTVLAMTFAMASPKNTADAPVKLIEASHVQEAADLVSYFMWNLIDKMQSATTTEEADWAQKILQKFTNKGTQRNTNGGITEKRLRKDCRASQKDNGRLFSAGLDLLMKEGKLFSYNNSLYLEIDYLRMVANGIVTTATPAELRKAQQVMKKLEEQSDEEL